MARISFGKVTADVVLFFAKGTPSGVLILALALSSTAALAQGDEVIITAPGQQKPQPLPLPRLIQPIGGDLTVNITRARPSNAHKGTISVTLSGEVVGEEAAKELSWRSMRSLVLVECGHGTSQLQSMSVYPAHGGLGPSSLVNGPFGWLKPAPQAYMNGVIARVCDRFPTVAGALAEGVELRPALPLGGPSQHRLAAAQASTPISTTRPPVAGPARVQVAAEQSPSEAHTALNKVMAALGAAASSRGSAVMPALVKGRLFYRAELLGFNNLAEAMALCNQIRRSALQCFVRAGS